MFASAVGEEVDDAAVETSRAKKNRKKRKARRKQTAIADGAMQDVDTAKASVAAVEEPMATEITANMSKKTAQKASHQALDSSNNNNGAVSDAASESTEIRKKKGPTKKSKSSAESKAHPAARRQKYRQKNKPKGDSKHKRF